MLYKRFIEFSSRKKESSMKQQCIGKNEKLFPANLEPFLKSTFRLSAFAAFSQGEISI
jgi:hypothetical protein